MRVGWWAIRNGFPISGRSKRISGSSVGDAASRKTGPLRRCLNTSWRSAAAWSGQRSPAISNAAAVAAARRASGQSRSRTPDPRPICRGGSASLTSGWSPQRWRYLKMPWRAHPVGRSRHLMSTSRCWSRTVTREIQNRSAFSGSALLSAAAARTRGWPTR